MKKIRKTVKRIKLNNEDLVSIRDKYFEIKKTNKQRAENYLFVNCHYFVNMFLVNFRIRPEYREEASSFMWLQLIKAFNLYDAEKGYKLSTWCFQLLKQAAFDFIGKKTKELKKYSILNNDDNGEMDNQIYTHVAEEYEDKEKAQRNSEYLKQTINTLIPGPLEREVFCRYNGVLGYNKESLHQISLNTCIREKTVESIINANKYVFKKFSRWLSENKITYSDYSIADVEYFREYVLQKK